MLPENYSTPSILSAYAYASLPTPKCYVLFSLLNKWYSSND